MIKVMNCDRVAEDEFGVVAVDGFGVVAVVELSSP